MKKFMFLAVMLFASIASASYKDELSPKALAEPVTLVGTIVDTGKGLELHVEDVGKYDVSGSSLKASADEVHVTATYTGNGVLANAVALKPFEQRMIDEANRYRKYAGSPPLVPLGKPIRLTSREHGTTHRDTGLICLIAGSPRSVSAV